MSLTATARSIPGTLRQEVIHGQQAGVEFVERPEQLPRRRLVATGGAS